MPLILSLCETYETQIKQILLKACYRLHVVIDKGFVTQYRNR